ncbi:MAG: alpha/beta hydrolase [Solirubrobacteraceae bacterium]
MRRAPWILVVLLVAAIALGRPGVDAALAPVLDGVALSRPCPHGLGAGWRCATVTVPLDRSHRVPGSVGLAVALLHRPGPPRPAVLALAGGPGEAAIPDARTFAARLAPLLRTRDLLVIDQRGTGVSRPISCSAIDAEPTWSAADVAGCARRLGSARAFFSSADTVADVRTVRHALGIARLLVFGVSYGTKVAVDVARGDPAHVSGLVLDSPIVEDTDPFYRRSARGAARVLRNVCAEAGCPRGSDPVADLRALVGRMRGGRLGPIGEGSLLHAIVAGGGRLHALPAALHQATAGDLRPLARLLPAVVPDARAGDWLARSGSHTMYLVTSCEDGSFPWRRDDSPAARAAAAGRYLDRLGDRAFAPFDRFAGAQYGETAICAPWPEAAGRRAPRPLPGVPALLLVGGDDDIAPLEGAREIAGGLPRAQIVTVPGAGHGVLAQKPAADALAAWAAAHPG